MKKANSFLVALIIIVKLGHPDRYCYNPIPAGTATLMKSFGPDNFYTPRSHDIADIRAKY